ncbi:General transcription factor II-I repeat domain-containing protein 2B [Merluccius polli]|uniref:General transcription factor II-I repeat domain-containing protein 2B n=1 Tax=Merluccius polli TaxID=89951 RepID=A0AA47NPP2_MERPO|nr:General transcription factor II-I repeat domain-containing protein 2B [Merluccius polli]
MASSATGDHLQQQAATEASFRVSHLLAKHKKPFTDGELMKEAMAIVANTVFNDFKNKDDIKAALSSVPLGPATVTRRVESLSEDVDQQVLRDLARCEYFSVQLDESLDVTDTAQLIVFVRMVFQDSTTKEDFLTLLHLKDRTRDITAKLNALNTDLQGKNRHLSHMISAVNAFKAKFCVWTTLLNSRKLTHVPNLEKMSQAIQDKDAFHPDQYCAHLDKVAAEFSRRFGELDIMEDISTFVSNPFQSTDVEKVSAKFEQVFGLQSGVDMEIIDLQNDIELKSRSRDSDFWGLVSRERFPLLTACALKVSAYFGSTYLCEMAFSQMKIIKSKYRSCLTDVHLTDCLRLAVCSYEPNYKELADNIQSQPSH